MSFTLTSTPQKLANKQSVIYLSPTKRRPITANEPPTSLKLQHSKHTQNELKLWVQRSDAVASCFIRDVFNLEPNETNKRDPEFYWLGSVPCRSVRVVGMIVGAQTYEKRTIYTVDDGTGIIDCAHRHQLPKHSPKSEVAVSKYQRVEPVRAAVEVPEPMANVGQFVQVTGIVGHSFECRQITVDKIGLCSSSNDELYHAKAVRELHRTSYSRTHAFMIPPLQKVIPQTPIKQSPITNLGFPSPPSSVSSSPIKDLFHHSPVKPLPTKQSKPSPVKLRHPARLHTHDLNANIFRIYVKYYMDCIFDESFASPTRGSQFDETPRPSSRYHGMNDSTPRRIPRLDYGLGPSGNQSISPQPCPSQARAETRKGFTLSYLRRVPELSLLASRVVDAVSKRRVREEVKKLAESGLPTPRTMPSSKLSPQKKHAKVKELFRWAIIKHLQEGCLVIWDGPIRRCPDNSVADASKLWKVKTPASTEGGTSKVFSTTLGTSFLTEDNDGEDMLSDPDPDEEAYVSLTPDFIASIVEGIITVVVKRKEAARNPYAGATKEEILVELKKDDRWQHLGIWMIEDALGILKADQRAHHSKDGLRWDVTA